MKRPFTSYADVFVLLTRSMCALLALACTGCFYSGPIGCSNRPNVIIMRGPGGYFPNIGELEVRFLDEGVCPTVAHPDAAPALAERIMGGRNQGRLSGPIVIVGYSSGADAAITLASKLGAKGVEVEKLVLLEASDARRVPPNVHQCVNIYKSQAWDEYVPFFVGYPLQVSNESTEIVNYNLRDYNDGRYDWEHHLSLAGNPHIQDLIVDEVMEAFELEVAEASPETIPDLFEDDDSEPTGAGRSARLDPVPLPAEK